MTSRKPPRLAAWLLKWTGAAEDPLAGDLLEEFQNGRSAAWFWRQSLFAVIMGVGRELRVSGRYYSAVGLGFGVQACVSYWLLQRSWPHLSLSSNLRTGALLLGAFWWLTLRTKAPSRRGKQWETFASTACAHFFIYLLAYCLSATLVPDQSFGFWAANQAFWLFSNLVTDLRRRASS